MCTFLLRYISNSIHDFWLHYTCMEKPRKVKKTIFRTPPSPTKRERDKNYEKNELRRFCCSWQLLTKDFLPCMQIDPKFEGGWQLCPFLYVKALTCGNMQLAFLKAQHPFINVHVLFFFRLTQKSPALKRWQEIIWNTTSIMLISHQRRVILSGIHYGGCQPRHLSPQLPQQKTRV